MKIAATTWFQQFFPQGYHIMQDYTVSGNDWDIVAIEFYDGDTQRHLEIVSDLRPRTKKLIVVESEPVSWAAGSFVNHAMQLKVHDISLYADCIFNSVEAHTGTAISWFVTNDNYYQSTLPHWQTWSNNILSRLTPGFQRPYLFDCLLGSHRSHRDHIHDLITNSDLRPRFVLTYFGKDISQGTWPRDLDPTQAGIHTAGLVNYLGERIPLSAILPVDIYNSTYYSVVAETTCDNTYSHFTEKIAKPILARRPFVVIAGQHYLRNLRRLGFKTFDGIGIDEFYDSIEDTDQRCRAVWQQIKSLSEKDPREVYLDVATVLEHNFQHFMRTDWYGALRREISMSQKWLQRQGSNLR